MALPLCFNPRAVLAWGSYNSPTMVIFDSPISGASTRSISAAQLQRFARRAQMLARVKGDVDILIATNKRLRDLNRRFRRKTSPLTCSPSLYPPAVTSPSLPKSPVRTLCVTATAWPPS